MYQIHVSDICIRYMYQMYVSDVCIRYMYQIYVSDIWIRYMDQVHVPDIWILKTFACKRVWSCPNKPDNNVTLYFEYTTIFDYTNIHRLLNLTVIYSRKHCYCQLWQRKQKQSHYGRRIVTYRGVVFWNLARNDYININLAFACNILYCEGILIFTLLVSPILYFLCRRTLSPVT